MQIFCVGLLELRGIGSTRRCFERIKGKKERDEKHDKEVNLEMKILSQRRVRGEIGAALEEAKPGQEGMTKG